MMPRWIILIRDFYQPHAGFDPLREMLKSNGGAVTFGRRGLTTDIGVQEVQVRDSGSFPANRIDFQDLM